MITEPVGKGTELPMWQAFYNYAKHQTQSYDSPNVHINGSFSLLLSTLQEDKMELYFKCGFCQDVFDKLDGLLFSVEERCLPKIVTDYERFKLSTEHLSDPLLPESNSTQPDFFHDLCKLSEPPPATIQEVDKYPNKGENANIPEDENLGRGKRKKFLKLKFDFLEPKPKLTHQSKVEEKSLQSNTNSVVNLKQKLKKPFPMNSEATKTSPASAKLYKERLSTDSSISGIIVPSTKSEKRESQELEKGDKANGLSLNKSDPLISSEDMDKKINVVRKKRKRNSEISYEKDFPSFDSACEATPKKSKNLKLDESEGRVVCCLGERINVKHLTKDLKTEKNEQQPLKSEDDLGNEQVCSLSDSKPKVVKKEQKLKKERPPGERYYLDCDLLAPMVCAACRVTFTSVSKLTAHRREKQKENDPTHTGKAFLCPKCDKTFATSHGYKLHHRIHIGAKPHICSECNRPFRTYKCLLDHMNTHKRELTFPCPTCMKIFGSQRLMKQHMKRHTEKPRPFACELCGKTFPRRPSLLIHMSSVHRKERPHKCTYCGVAFNQRGSLTTHMRLHTGDKHHICDICGGRFNTNVAMITHRRKHTGEKPYKCDLCDFRASSSSSLKDHKSTHGNEKPYPCQVANCNRSFKRRSHLISHHKTHIGARPYKCHTCGLSFMLTSELKKHLRQNSCQAREGIKMEAAVPVYQFSEALPEDSFALETEGQVRVCQAIEEIKTEAKFPALHFSETLPKNAFPLETQDQMKLENQENRDLEEDLPLADCVGGEENPVYVESLAELPENSVVIEIIHEPGKENPGDLVLSKEEMEAILRISQNL